MGKRTDTTLIFSPKNVLNCPSLTLKDKFPTYATKGAVFGKRSWSMVTGPEGADDRLPNARIRPKGESSWRCWLPPWNPPEGRNPESPDGPLGNSKASSAQSARTVVVPSGVFVSGSKE